MITAKAVHRCVCLFCIVACALADSRHAALRHQRSPPFTSAPRLQNKSAPNFAVVAVAINDSPNEQPAFDTLLENKRQYCVRHGCDLLVADQEYPLFDHADAILSEPDRRILEKALDRKVPWLPCPWNIPLTLIAATRIMLDRDYDWVLYQQLDTVFVNMDISLDSIAARAPPDAHIILTANMGYVVNDVAVLVRNSVQGKDMLDRIIELQRRMRACPAPGMAVIDTFFLHQLNGTVVNGGPVYYRGECEQTCGDGLKSFDDMWQYDKYYKCLEPWYRKFHVDRWHVRNVSIPGFWIQPGATPIVYESQLPVLGDDITPFGLPPMLNDGYNSDEFVPPDSFALKPKYAVEPAFCLRFPTTLSFHTGGNTRTPRAPPLAADVARLFKPCTYSQQTVLVEDTLVDVAVRPGWSALLMTFTDVQCQEGYLHDGTPLKEARYDDFADTRGRGCRYILSQLKA